MDYDDNGIDALLFVVLGNCIYSEISAGGENILKTENQAPKTLNV
jgi:hypothetical protein